MHRRYRHIALDHLYWFLCSCETMSRCDPSQGLLWMYVCKMGTGFISRQNYTEKRLTLQSPCHHVVMPVRRTIITSVISILRMICKAQSPLYSIPGSVPRLLHIQNYIQTFRSAKACQKMQRCAREHARQNGWAEAKCSSWQEGFGRLC